MGLQSLGTVDVEDRDESLEKHQTNMSHVVLSLFGKQTIAQMGSRNGCLNQNNNTTIAVFESVYE